jgi:hypothetical protein
MNARLRTWRDAFDTWFDARGELRGVSLFRVCAGPLVAAHLWPFYRAALHGEYYRTSFYVPWFAHYPEPSLPVYTALLTLGMLAAAALSCGIYARVASWLCAGVVAYNFFLSETFFHHNRAFLLTFLGGLCLLPGDDSLALYPRHRDAQATHALWPLWLWRVLACTPYLASSTSKLLDPDWFGGVVTWDRVVRHRHLAEHIVPSAVIDIVASPELHFWLAKLVIAQELAVGIGLWFGRTRYLAVWLALVFHGLIQATAQIQVFSALGIAGLLIWTTPVTRDRTLALRLDLAAGRRFATCVRALDWLARFEIVRTEVGSTVALRERNGSVFTGKQAVWRVLARLPLTAGVGLPAIGFDLARRTITDRDETPHDETPADSYLDHHPTS